MRSVYGLLGVGIITAGVGVWFRASSPGAATAALEVPSLTAWGKIFSFLLLAALGVAYLVWRRPVDRARAILETSPLGSEEQTGSLVDWGLCAKVVVLVEVLAVATILGFRIQGYALSAIDTLGVLGVGAIVAFVIHLLWLSRRGGSGPSKRQ
jgi:hypothetical protein